MGARYIKHEVRRFATIDDAKRAIAAAGLADHDVRYTDTGPLRNADPALVICPTVITSNGKETSRVLALGFNADEGNPMVAAFNAHLEQL